MSSARLWSLAVLLTITEFGGEAGGPEQQRLGRSTDVQQPRIATERGNLVFLTGSALNIEFRTGSLGKIKLNDEDLSECLQQIQRNKDDIVQLKGGAAGAPQNITSQIHQLNSKLADLERKFQSLQQAVDKNVCSSNPCQNGGTCLNLHGAFFCICPSQWKGPLCSADVNECEIYSGTPMSCQNGATCINTLGSYRCSCSPDTYGPQCASRYDDCALGSQVRCGRGICEDSIREHPGEPKYSCRCDAGWMSPPGSPDCTQDVDECSLQPAPCSPLVQCFNTPGSFYCGACPSGWQGNGYHCQDINECEINNGGCSEVPLVECVNTIGSYHCQPCPPGYQGNGKVCTLIDICSVNNGGCHPQASCSSVLGSLPLCTCHLGYTGNGYGQNGCVQLSNICLSHPCLNGQCIETASGYLCKCAPGWAGINCTENINECLSRPCSNGGTCVDGVNAFSCECSSGWTGSHCQVPQQVCGGSLSEKNGSFSYRSPDVGYAHDVNCFWVIRTEEGKVLRVTFSFFQLESADNCPHEFLQVYDGESSAGLQLGRFCGASPPREVLSSDNALYFHFYSEHFRSGRGFTVRWATQQPACGGRLTGAYGSITSPGYPGNYPPGRDCVWKVMAAPGLLVTFTFGTLSLEHHDDCSKDYLEIRDGPMQTDPVLGKFCTTLSTPPLQTTGPLARVHFHSDAQISDQGFHITYLTSPSGPLAHSRQCIYIIEQPVGEKIQINFTHVELGGQTGCSPSSIEVLDEDIILGKFCGDSTISHMNSITNRIWIRFKIDASIAKAGFRAVYQVACGGALTGEGVIRSPLHPNVYPGDRVCRWAIHQPQRRVVLNVTAFDIGPSAAHCDTDYMEVGSSSILGSPENKKYCGSDTPSLITSVYNFLYITFVKSSSSQNHGFMATFSSADFACGEVLIEPTGTIQSPGHPNVYPHGINCTWHIVAQPGQLIRLVFRTFHLEFHYNCTNDYLEVVDTGTGTSLGRYCGRSIPPSLTSSANSLRLVFVADADLAYEGFEITYEVINAATACSEDYTMASGTFTSPNYPNNYPDNRECIYRITVGTSQQIALHFTNFSLEEAFGHCADFVEIRDGGYETSPSLGIYCGSKLPPRIISHSNKLWIKFKSDLVGSRSGFSANWDGSATGCGGNLTTPSGSFLSPNYPMPYYHSSECYWWLKSSHGSLFEVEFEDFHLEYHPNCTLDYLAVYDGPSTSSHLLTQLCGNENPPPIRSSGDSMFFKLRTDEGQQGGGFLASYRQICENVVIANRTSGILESIHYPNPYYANQRCNWTIQATRGNTVNYTFLAFEVERHTNCSADYLELYDGSHRIGRYCGTEIPASGSTVSPQLHVLFHTDGVGDQEKGFQMQWFIHGCGGELSGDMGFFSSPGYPNQYPPNKECVWYISTALGSSIQLTIHDFDVEQHASCIYDSLEVYGGPDFHSPRIAQLCAHRSSENPMQVSSTGNELAIRFKTDSSINGRGFNVSWHAVPGGCGGNFNVPSGEIHSPNYPSPYRSNSECSWLIQVEKNHRVLLNFTDFDLEPQDSCIAGVVKASIEAPAISLVANWKLDVKLKRRSNILLNHITLSFSHFELQSSTACVSDFVEILDGKDHDAPPRGRHCGNSLPHPITSFSNALTLRFVSDGVGTYDGFRAIYVASSSVCGGTFSMMEGTFNSPGYPDVYPPHVECIWNIVSSPGNQLQLSFTTFQLEDSRDCSRDFVEMREGNATGLLVGRYCGHILPLNYSSIVGHSLWVRFVSDGSGSGRGFQATFVHVFGNANIMGAQGTIASPLWPSNYPHNSNYQWIVNVNASQVIHGRILEMNIEASSNCYYDKLKIFDGLGILSRKIGTFCGTQPASFVSSRNSLTFQFSSDSSVSGKGFLLEWFAVAASDGPLPTIAPGACGGFLRTGDAPAFLFSPGWPEKYSDRADCAWLIHAPDSTVELNILSMDIESHESCYYDKLVVNDGDSSEAQELAVLCGKKIPGPIRSTGEYMLLRFTSDATLTGAGFNASFHKSCGGYLHADRGIIASPMYPEAYPPSLNCSWHVLVQSGLTIAVHFEQPFQIANEDASCNQGDYLVLKNGPDIYSPPLGPHGGNGRFCGSRPFSTIFTSDNEMFVQFISDHSHGGQGFKIKYEAKSLACGGNIYVHDADAAGYVSSPNYPDNYPQHADCIWILFAPPGKLLQLQFEDQFNIEVTPNCTANYLELRDGADSNARLLSKLCGTSLPGSQLSSEEVMYLRFRSDNSPAHVGFKAKYSIALCGGRVTGQSSIIESIGYPALPYQDNLFCEWQLQAPSGHYITIHFEDFHLQNSSGCEKDFVEIWDNHISGNTLGRFCGNTFPDRVETSGNVALVRFVTDGSLTASGFRLRFESSVEKCGGDLQNPTGTFASPNYQSPNSHRRLCEWRLTVQEGRRISLTFNNLRLEAQPSCNNEHVMVFNGIRSDSPLLETVCSSVNVSNQIKSSGNTMKVIFFTDGSRPYGGFLASYTSSEDAVCGGPLSAFPGGNFSSPDCGGIQTGESGVITSPNYPASYDRLAHCSWLLEAPPGHTITLTFSDFDIESHATCAWDSVTVRNGGSPGSPIIGHYCGQSNPGTIQSGSNQLVVSFNSDYSKQRGGFYATWVTQTLGCGGILHSDNGTIRSPRWPQQFPENSRCAWTVVTHESKHLELSFDSDFLLPSGDGLCQDSFVKVWAGSQEAEEALLATSCGNVAPSPIITPRNTFTAVFQSQGPPARGFSAAFISRCGGNFTGPSGDIVSPNYPKQYDNNVNCTYVIEASSQSVVLLTFVSFHLEARSAIAGSCVNDGVHIIRGYSLSSTPFATLCGDETPAPVSISGPVLLYFYSNAHITDYGFKFSYRIASCGGMFNFSTGIIRSPAYSHSDYPNHMYCLYTITVEENKLIQLKFSDFAVAPSTSCSQDYLAIYDGSNSSDPLLGKFCGSKLPPNVRSTNNSLLLVFKTDSAQTARGWRISFRQTLGPQQGCGGYLTGSNQTFASPDSDSNGRYDKNLNCAWFISAPINKLIKLTFNTFTLEAASVSQRCVYDYVKLFDGDSENAKLVGTFCGSSLPAPFISSGNFLTVQFVSDPTLEREGFNATYTIVDMLCGGTYNATRAPQTILSPNSSDPDAPLHTCTWVMEAPSHQQLKITVLEVQLRSQDCSQNYVEFQDSPEINAHPGVRLCGRNISTVPEFYSLTRTAVVKFKSEVFNRDSRLSFTYQIADCSREYKQAFGNLKSPGWPAGYNSDLDCTVTLAAPRNHSISLFFHSFDIEASSGCTHDFLEIRNGPDSSYPLLGKYCGNLLPNPVFTQSNELYLRFKSDNAISAPGYEIVWTSSPSGCGGTLYGDSGSFTSPGYPGSYHNNTHCEWTITAPAGRPVTVSFHFISIDDPGDCVQNYLILYDGPDAESPSTGPYCGADTEIFSFVSSSHRVFIRFHAEYALLPSGFWLTWTS
ncbi:cubilin [Echinops telfairi]|uniref:Cubilin n=1 Tax=Echinops telfairi TaxID=9371 RepID=A0ABM0J6M4_ECHTE|nr:cubilin [Echinops telfairi]